MKLDHIPLEALHVSPLNVRKKGGKDIADLLPLIRQHGIIQPLLVRPNQEGFEIVAGQRRYNCLLALKEEGIAEPVPCIIMEEGDDAKAIEASLIENLAHLPMEEIDQYKAFSALNANGMAAGDIAAHFGVTERLVHQRLAIAGIIEPILNAYRREEIGADTLRVLTMATPKQQKTWWKLFKADDAYVPTGWQLKQWLFGGAQIATANALFNLADYKGAIVSDLFGEDSYFADAAAFWPLQNAAIAAKRDAYLAQGWDEVVILEIGQRFATWEHEKVVRTRGGKVFVSIAHNGEISFHEGWLTMKEARRKERAEAAGAPTAGADRPELTKPMRNYLGLHKHAAVRTELLDHPGVALRLAVAHMIAGSGLWSIRADEQRAESEAIAQSLVASKATTAFTGRRAAIRTMIATDDDADHDDRLVEHDDADAADDDGHDDRHDDDRHDEQDEQQQDDDDDRTIVGTRFTFGSRRSLPAVFAKLLAMEDEAVMRILTFVMAETLEAHTPIIETLGELLGTDMRNWWAPDQVFFDLLRNKAAINAMVREIAGSAAADANIAATAKVQKKIIADCLDGTRAAQVENWLPRYMALPTEGYREDLGG
ncbi:MAG: ParB/RepB/Spo0J family partition protein [Parvibaculaceae bacterium]